MIDQVARIVISFELVLVIFPRNGKHEVAYHRETYHKKHVAQVLQKENGKNTIKDKGQLDPKVQAVYINKTGKYRIKYKIAKQRRVILTKRIEQQSNNTDARGKY